MTSEKWKSLPQHTRESIKDLSGLSPQLTGLEGWRVEVITTYGEKRRFIIGKSTGWRPCHIEVNNRRSMGGPSAEKTYASVTKLYFSR